MSSQHQDRSRRPIKHQQYARAEAEVVDEVEVSEDIRKTKRHIEVVAVWSWRRSQWRLSQCDEEEVVADGRAACQQRSEHGPGLTRIWSLNASEDKFELLCVGGGDAPEQSRSRHHHRAGTQGRHTMNNITTAGKAARLTGIPHGLV